jgi:Tol biopolymer transport system component/tRNA A-37 threonylcarbamoyl transferase component Bud32
VTSPTERLTSSLAERYRIERQLGQGGMALVYLAHDLRHDRRVALKLLRPELAAVLGAERFLNEIKVTAHLQHPHILPLHDSGEVNGLVFYVMPYVEGESLRDKLHREKQLGIEEALEITRAVAGALDYAHRHGVIHRDIKPENILLHDGQALVADFGIALAVSAAAGGSRLTETGLSLGTPHYMSPEQAMGERALDARSDIYSLSAVLYEMLAGEPPYTGPTAQAIVAKVLTAKPVALTEYRDTVPPHVAAAIHKALAKLPADRFHSAAEFAEALVRPGAVPLTSTDVAFAPGVIERRRDWRLAAFAAAAAVAAGLALWGWLRPAPPARLARFSVTLPKGQEVADLPSSPTIALSPDGSRLVYVGAAASGQPQLLLRPLDQLTVTPIPGTERAQVPFFSSDGKSVAFFSPFTVLKVVSLAGGPPLTLTDSAAGSGSWGADGWIYFARPGQIWRMRVSGGARERLTADTSGSVSYRGIEALPSGSGVVFTIWRGGLADAEIAVLSLRTRQIKKLVRGTYARYARSGHLVYTRFDGALLAAPFDQSRLELTGPATPLIEGIVVKPGGGSDFTLSDGGMLVYSSGESQLKQLVWVNSDGTEHPLDPTLRRDFRAVALSPDGARIAVSFPAELGSTVDVWVYDLRQRTLSRLTYGGQNDRPVWTPDGRRVTFVSNRKGLPAIYTTPWDGSGPAESLLASSRGLQEPAWSRDGRVLVLREGLIAGPGSRDIIYLRPGLDSAPRPFLATSFEENTPTPSPDGRWLAYVSDESGHQEVYVRPFPGPGGRGQVSDEGGVEPLWSPDGRSLYYRSAAGDLMTADIRVVPTLVIGSRRKLFSTTSYQRGGGVYRAYALSPDGRRFLFMKREGGAREVELRVVLNWFDELKRRAGR